MRESVRERERERGSDIDIEREREREWVRERESNKRVIMIHVIYLTSCMNYKYHFLSNPLVNAWCQ